MQNSPELVRVFCCNNTKNNCLIAFICYYVLVDLSVCDRELFIADTIYGIERTLDSYVLRLSPMTNRSMIDCLAEIAENLMISVVEKREKEGKRAGSTRSALTFSNLQKILTVSPLKVIEQIFSDESIEFNRPLVLTISHVERISEENLVQIILELKSLTNNLVVLSFAGCFSEVPYSDSVNLEGTMIVTQFSTESNYTYFNTIMEDLLLGDKLPFILSVALIDAIHRNFFSLERCVRTSIRRYPINVVIFVLHYFIFVC